MSLLYNEGLGRKNNFDFLRLILALAVIFSHSYVVCFGPENFPDPLYLFSHKQVSFGTLAVNYFFVISGYLIAESWFNSKGAFNYLKKRLFRIYPAFIVVCLLCIFLFAPLGNRIYSDSLAGYLKYLHQVNFNYNIYTTFNLSQPLAPETFSALPCKNELNTSVWTIWYEFVCYLLVLVLGVCRLLQRRGIVFIIFLLLFGIFLLLLYANISPAYVWMNRFFTAASIERLFNLVHFLSFFLAGTCFYIFRNKIMRSNLLILVSVTLLIISARYTSLFLPTQVIFGSYILFAFAFSKKIRLYKTAARGDFSYGLYLYGWPIQQLVLFFTGVYLPVTGNFIISMAFILPFAIASWFLIEKPFLKLKNFNFLPLKNLSFVTSLRDGKPRP